MPHMFPSGCLDVKKSEPEAASVSHTAFSDGSVFMIPLLLCAEASSIAGTGEIQRGPAALMPARPLSELFDRLIDYVLRNLLEYLSPGVSGKCAFAAIGNLAF